MLSPPFLFLCSLLLFLFPIQSLLLLRFSTLPVSFQLGLVGCFLISLLLTFCLLNVGRIRILKQIYIYSKDSVIKSSSVLRKNLCQRGQNFDQHIYSMILYISIIILDSAHLAWR